MVYSDCQPKIYVWKLYGIDHSQTAISDQSCFSDVCALCSSVPGQSIFAAISTSINAVTPVCLQLLNTRLGKIGVCVCYLSHRLQLKLDKVIKTQQTHTCRDKLYNKKTCTFNVVKPLFIRTSLTTSHNRISTFETFTTQTVAKVITSRNLCSL